MEQVILDMDGYTKATDVLEALRSIQSLLEIGWARNASARDEHGHPTSATAADACRWCVTGANDCTILILDPDYRHREYQRSIHAICERILLHTAPAVKGVTKDDEYSIVEVNDALRSHRAVILWLERAIAQAQQERDRTISGAHIG